MACHLQGLSLALRATGKVGASYVLGRTPIHHPTPSHNPFAFGSCEHTLTTRPSHLDPKPNPNALSAPTPSRPRTRRPERSQQHSGVCQLLRSQQRPVLAGRQPSHIRIGLDRFSELHHGLPPPLPLCPLNAPLSALCAPTVRQLCALNTPPPMHTTGEHWGLPPAFSGLSAPGLFFHFWCIVKEDFAPQTCALTLTCRLVHIKPPPHTYRRPGGCSILDEWQSCGGGFTGGGGGARGPGGTRASTADKEEGHSEAGEATRTAGTGNHNGGDGRACAWEAATTKGMAWPASPVATGCQGNPCSTGIRWGVSPAAQMGCLRNRSRSPSGADQR